MAENSLEEGAFKAGPPPAPKKLPALPQDDEGPLRVIINNLPDIYPAEVDDRTQHLPSKDIEADVQIRINKLPDLIDEPKRNKPRRQKHELKKEDIVVLRNDLPDLYPDDDHARLVPVYRPPPKQSWYQIWKKKAVSFFKGFVGRR